LFGSTEEFRNERLKKEASSAGFGKCHAHIPGSWFSAIFHQLRAIGAEGDWSPNPKKWENPEISTEATGFGRSLLYS